MTGSIATLRNAANLGWLAANVIGMGIFLRWSKSCCWIEPELKDVPGASGGAAIIWALGPLPVLLAFVLANFAWGIIVENRSPPERRWKSIVVPMVILSGWVASFAFDGLHHGS